MNKLLHKAIFGVLIFIMLTPLIPIHSDAATFQLQYLTFAENEDGTLTVIAYNRDKHERPYNLTIPSQCTFNNQTYTVSAIGDGVFKGHTFYSIYVGSGISIGNHAFENVIVNNYLTSFSKNETVRFEGDKKNNYARIGDYAFANAKFYSYVTFGGFTTIGSYAFHNAYFGSTDINIFESVLFLGHCAFKDSNITSMSINPQNLCTLGDYSLYGTHITSFNIYSSLDSIGAHVFPEDYPITFNVQSYVDDISFLSFEKVILDTATFQVHVNSPIIDYLNNNHIAYYIIENDKLVLPKAHIGQFLTYASDGTYLSPNSSSLPSTSSILSLKVTDNDSMNLTKIETTTNAITLNSSYNYNNYPYTIDTIESYTVIGDNCPILDSVALESTSITTIQTNAFTSCSTLKLISLPKTVKTIEKNAFPNIKNLSISIPAEITDIQNFDIGNLTNVIFIIDENSPLAATLSNMGLTYQRKTSGIIVYPRPANGSTFTAKALKYKIINKSSVTMLQPVNAKLNKLTIPSTITYKGYTYKVTKINQKAFYKCTRLKTVSIGDNVTSIGNNAFAKCSNLKTITFGKNVKTLGKKVLYHNTNLSKIKFKGTNLQSIGKQTFRKVPKSVRIIVPTSKVEKYSNIIKKAQ